MFSPHFKTLLVKNKNKKLQALLLFKKYTLSAEDINTLGSFLFLTRSV